MYETIVVPTDGSDLAGRALDRAIALAGNADATVHVVHVITATAFSTVEGGVPLDLVEEDGLELVEEAAARARSAGVAVETVVLTGSPHRAIADHASDVDADLVVMGTHGRTGLAHVALGSVAERVVRTSTVPVVTVGPDAPATGRCDTILVPTDGSKAALAALPHAFDLASRYGATVHALSVVDTSAYGIEVSLTGLAEELRAECEAAVQAVADQAPEGCPVTTEIRDGVPHVEICACIADHNVDLVVMGTRGRSGLERLVLGSVTARVVRSATVPVLAVPPPDA